MIKTSLNLAPFTSLLKKANAHAAKRWPGDSPERQPVHTVYGGAQLFKADSCQKLGQLALNALHRNAAEPTVLAEALGIPMELANTVYVRVEEKLKREAVEDFRIDFEDGYGNRPDAEEDGHAAAAAHEVVEAMAKGILPPFIGIRVKTFSDELHKRSLRTLDIFLNALAGKKRRLPPWFCVTLPKITSAAQVAALDKALTQLEAKLKLPKKSIHVELMIETTQSVLLMREMVDAGGGRVTGAHFGTYDYTASYNVTAAHQKMSHEACDFAKHNMKVKLTQTGVFLSDGATNVMPVGPNKGHDLTDAQVRENVETVHRAWKLHYDDVRHSLVNAFYQGWDLHPAQLVSRYAALYTFFLEGLEPASARLNNFIGKAAQATLVGDVFDDAATGQGLLNYFLRGLSCGAMTQEEAAKAGLTRAELETRSFLKILEGRRKKA
jgi:citrate lyase beta subunit